MNSVIGHEKIIRFLEESQEKNKLVHAYIFVGPEHVGKTKVAIEFAYKILGRDSKNTITTPEAEQLLGILSHPDFSFVERIRDEKTNKLKKNISVEQIRDLITRLGMSSFLNSYKVAIIPETESLSTSGANSLLKTLEEPKGKTVIILCVKTLENILPTIISRCQIINFSRVSREEILEKLIKSDITKEEAINYTHLSFGRPGIALNFLHSKETFEDYKIETEKCIKLLSASLADRFLEVENYFSSKIDAQERRDNLDKILLIWSSFFRDLIYIKNNCSDEISNIFIKNNLEKLSLNFSNKQALRIFNSIENSKKYLLNNVNPRLVFENLVLNF